MRFDASRTSPEVIGWGSVLMNIRRTFLGGLIIFAFTLTFWYSTGKQDSLTSLLALSIGSYVVAMLCAFRSDEP